MTLSAFITRSREDKEAWRYTDLPALLAQRRSKSGGVPLPLPVFAKELRRGQDQVAPKPLGVGGRGGLGVGLLRLG